MKWIIDPEEYRYVLGDFIRSGVSVNYTQVFVRGEKVLSCAVDVDGNPVFTYPDARTIYFPYITGRQYEVYKSYHCVVSENESLGYQILSEAEAGDLDYEIEDFRNWDYFKKAFEVDGKEFCNHTDICYAFVFDYAVRFLDLPIRSLGDITDYECLLVLADLGFDIGEHQAKSIKNEGLLVEELSDIQKHHIFEIYENYIRQKPFYPLNMSLEWFYLATGLRLNVDTLLNSMRSQNVVDPDKLIANCVIDVFPTLSENDVIELFRKIRDRYTHIYKADSKEWYAHTSHLMSEILAQDLNPNVARKVKRLRSFCNNTGSNIYDILENKVPYFNNVLRRYQKQAERIYKILLDNDYIDDQTLSSDFVYYLTGDLEVDIQGKIHWKRSIADFVDFLLCITGNNPEWTTASYVVVDKKGKSLTPNSLKSTKSRKYGEHTDKFECLLK
jgi:hypothetical protein